MAYYAIVKELIIEDRLGFKSMFRMSLEDFERVRGTKCWSQCDYFG